MDTDGAPRLASLRNPSASINGPPAHRVRIMFYQTDTECQSFCSFVSNSFSESDLPIHDMAGSSPGTHFHDCDLLLRQTVKHVHQPVDLPVAPPTGVWGAKKRPACFGHIGRSSIKKKTKIAVWWGVSLATNALRCNAPKTC